jgi:hypothetical protein
LIYTSRRVYSSADIATLGTLERKIPPVQEQDLSQKIISYEEKTNHFIKKWI